MNNLKSYTEYAVTTSTTDFVIGFDFNYGTDAVNVTVDGKPASIAGYTVVYLNSTTMRLTPAVTSGVVRLQRETDIDVPDNRFTAGAKFIASNMDENFQQIRHAQQEVRDAFDFLEYNTLGVVEAAREATATAEAAAELVNDTVAEFQDAINTIVVEDGVPATAVSDASGKTQQEINDELAHLKKVVTVDIRDFGAKCDNATDDSAAIQAAIDYVASQGGGEVRCSGQIRITQTITIRDKVSLVAPWIGRVSYNVYSAAIIRKTTSGPFFAHESTSLAWGLRNLLMIGSYVVSIGFDITKAQHCNIDNCMFTDCVDIGWNFVSRTGPITFCEFTRLGNKGARIGAVIDYDSSVEGTYNNGNRYGFSIFLRHTEIGIWYKYGGSNTLECYGGEVASVEPNTISLRYDNGVAQMIGDWWAEPKYGNAVVVNGGVLTIVGNGRLLGEIVENGGTILWDHAVGVWQYPIFPSLQREGIKHAYSFREGSLRDVMGNKDLTKAGIVDANPASSRYGSMMQLNGANSYMYLDSTSIDWSQDWTIAICARAIGNASAVASVAFRIQKGVSDASQHLAVQGIPDNTFFTVTHYKDGVSQKSGFASATARWGNVYQWGFIKYDSTAKKIYGSRGMNGEGDSFWFGEGFELDLSTFLSGNSRVVLGQAGGNRTFCIDELLIMQRQITPKEMIAINGSAIDLEAMLGTIPVSTINPSASVTYDPPSIPTGESITTTVTVNGARLGDVVHVGFTRFNADIEITAVVSATNTVTVKFKNQSAAPIDLGSGTLNVKVI